ncbi:MAG: hypothetical protein PHX59_05660 [Sulfuricurvum sp.]|nr:hypothetical protein [Sulfuricurvum sp.]
MEERSFKGITARFGYSLAWCFGLGIITGLLYKLPYPDLQNTMKVIVTENSAPKSFHLIAVASVICLGVLIALFGRTEGEISRFKYLIGYKAAEVALALAAVFYGLLFGFSLAVWQWPLFAAGFYAFLITAGLLILLLWLSFARNGIRSEIKARLYSMVLVAVSIGVVWFEYFR